MAYIRVYPPSPIRGGKEVQDQSAGQPRPQGSRRKSLSNFGREEAWRTKLGSSLGYSFLFLRLETVQKRCSNFKGL